MLGEFAVMETFNSPIRAATGGKAVWSPFATPTTAGEVRELGPGDAAHRLPGGTKRGLRRHRTPVMLRLWKREGLRFAFGASAHGQLRAASHREKPQ